MKVIVLGSRGMLGTDLCFALAEIANVIGLDKEEIDVTDEAVVSRMLSKLKPTCVINATGYTDVDGAEANREAAFVLNDQAVKFLAEATAAVSAKFVHFSTEMVFNGENESGYDELIEPKPINTYGESKAAGEKHVLAYEAGGYLVRSSWLYGKAPQRGKPRGLNFIETVLKLAAEKPAVRVVNDQFGKPTSTKDLAAAVAELVKGSYAPGVYHLVNEEAASWYDVAKEIWRLRGLKTSLVPIASSEYLSPATRPKYGLLINNKYPRLRPWPAALQDYLNL